MNYLRSAKHVFVCGKSGMGKTTFAIRFINGSSHDRVFIFDHQSEFALRLGIPPDKVAHNPEEFLALAKDNRIVPYDFTRDYPGMKEESFAEFAELVFDTGKQALEPQGMEGLFVCDELQQFVNVQNSPPEMKMIFETGRRYNLDTLSLSRAPNRVNSPTREEFTELVLFRLDDDNSLKFAENVGADVARVAALQKHEYLYYNVVRGHSREGELVFAGAGRV